MAVLGQVYGTLGRYDEAADLLLPALELRRRHMGPSDPEVARTAHQLADIRHIQGRLDEAERLMREAVKHGSGWSIPLRA
jgi:tetratricopeptide (TPR) repeat protein